MARIFYQTDADPTALAGKRVAVVGYGSQGHAHALNLRDSGVEVVVGLYPGSSSWTRAEAEGLPVRRVAEAAAEAQLIVILVPDPAQPGLYREHLQDHLEAGDTLLFAHGFNVHFKGIEPPEWVDVAMVAPKAPGHRMRELYREGVGVPALLAVHQDPSGRAWQTGLAYAHALGCTRAGVIATTFAEETETDLFGEQAVLCGGISELIKAGFETLVAAGYQPEVAYFECLHEMKLIVDLIYQGGLSYMRYSVSDTAEYGDYRTGKRIISPAVREEMQRVLAEVKDGSFAREWMEENERDRRWFLEAREREAEHAIEKVGGELRKMMGFLDGGKR